jgi:CBS domain-containing protein
MRREAFRRALREKGSLELKVHPFKKHDGEIVQIAKTEVVTVASTTPVYDTIQTMSKRKLRRIPIASPATRLLEGMVTATDIVDYLGGGQKFDIIQERFHGNVFKAINEAIRIIMNKKVVSIKSSAKISEAIDAMVKTRVGSMPVVDDENHVKAIITERDVVNLFADKLSGATVSQIMSRDAVTALVKTTIFEAEKTMVAEGFRRLPILMEGKVVGIITAMDIIRFFGSGQAFTYLRSGTITQVLNTPALEIASKQLVTIQPNEDIGQAARVMKTKGIGSLPVVKDEKLVGIVTERDFFKLIE